MSSASVLNVFGKRPMMSPTNMLDGAAVILARKASASITKRCLLKTVYISRYCANSVGQGNFQGGVLGVLYSDFMTGGGLFFPNPMSNRCGTPAS